MIDRPLCLYTKTLFKASEFPTSQTVYLMTMTIVSICTNIIYNTLVVYRHSCLLSVIDTGFKVQLATLFFLKKKKKSSTSITSLFHLLNTWQRYLFFFFFSYP